MNKLAKSLAVGMVAVLTSLLFFPRLLMFTEKAAGTYEWTQGLNFLDQVLGQPTSEV